LTPYHYAYIDKKNDIIKLIHDVLNLNEENEEFDF